MSDRICKSAEQSGKGYEVAAPADVLEIEALQQVGILWEYLLLVGLQVLSCQTAEQENHQSPGCRSPSKLY